MKQRLISLLLFAILVLIMKNNALSQEPHPFSVHDMLAMERLSDPQVSPDGQTIAFVLQKTDLEANKGRKDIWLVGADGQGKNN